MQHKGNIGSKGRQQKEISGYLREVERLGRQLLGAKFADPGAFWQFQKDLLALQRDIQASLSSEKKRPKRSRDHEKIRLLRICRLRARQLGDAFAWVLFGFNRRYLWALSDNSRVPVAQEGHGSVGLETIATHLASEGWGFPVLHDVTDCLRIGDVTFVRPHESEHRFLTVEVKTSVLGEEPRDDGTTKTEYQVKLISPMEFAPNGKVLSTPVSRGLKASNSPTTRARVERQAARMAEAAFRQLAEDGELVELPSGGHISMSVDSKGSNWKALRRVIREAHQSGYASALVDQAFFYLAFYQKGGLDDEFFQRALGLTNDLRTSGLFIEDRPEMNGVVISQVPPQDEDRVYHRFLPFYLFSIPKRAIFEILHGELVLMVLTNPGRIVEYLKGRGLEVELTRPDLGPDSIRIKQELVDDGGRSWVSEMRALEFHVHEAVHEFRSIEHIGDVTESMMQVARDNFTKIRSAHSGTG